LSLAEEAGSVALCTPRSGSNNSALPGQLQFGC
jgi:hypothetical protein